MAIEINPRLKYYQLIKSPLSIIIAVVIVLAVIMLSLYLYFSFSISGMKEVIDQKEAQAADLTKNINEREEVLIPIRDKINNFNSLVLAHSTPFGFFTAIEENTLAKVSYTGLEFNREQRRFFLAARADDLSALENQLSYFKADPLFESARVHEVSFTDDGAVRFNLELILNSDKEIL